MVEQKHAYKTWKLSLKNNTSDDYVVNVIKLKLLIPAENYKSRTTETSSQCFSPFLKTDMILKKVLGLFGWKVWFWFCFFVRLFGFGWVFVGLFFVWFGFYFSILLKYS